MREPELLNASASRKGAFLPVIYEDEDLLVLHKASGVPSVPHSPQETETAVGAALAHAPQLAGIQGARPLEPGLLHRLDTLTSGILAFAKSTSEYERLRGVWRANQVRKVYRARVPAVANPRALHRVAPLAELREPMELAFPLGRDPKSSRRMLALVGRAANTRIRGKPLAALTKIQRVQTGPLQPGREASLELELEIRTGVMHQIRVTLAAIGYPIVGDPIYRGSASERLWLHAWRLELPLKSGVQLKLQAALPDGWQAC